MQRALEESRVVHEQENSIVRLEGDLHEAPRLMKRFINLIH